MLSGRQLFDLGGWEQSGHTIANQAGDAVNPPTNLTITAPAHIVVRYTTTSTDAILPVNGVAVTVVAG